MNEILKKRIDNKAVGIGLEFRDSMVSGGSKRDVAEAMGIMAQAAAYKMANELLKDLWIPVEEALPEKNTMCFVRKKKTEIGFIYDADYIDFEGKWFFNFNRASMKSMVITHWMPVPELPKGCEK